MVLNINNRPDIILSNYWGDHSSKIKQTLMDLLPLLSLHKKTALSGFCGLFICHITELNWKQEKGKSACLVAAMASYIGIATLAPMPCLTFSSVFAIYSILKEPMSNIRKISMLAHQIIYVASMYYATPGLIALSLFCQMGTELYKATAGFTCKPSSLKDGVNVFVACVRLMGVFPHLERAYRNYFGKKLTQRDWDNLNGEISREMEKANEKLQVKKLAPLIAAPKIKLEGLLKKKGFSNVLEGLTLSRPSDTFFTSHVRFLISDVTYNDCSFSSRLFDNTDTRNTIFNRCDFLDSGRLFNSSFKSVIFNECDLAHSIFSECFLDRVVFNKCNLSHTIFHFSEFFNSRIFNSQLEGTCFLLNNVYESVIERCSLLNTLLLEAKKQFSFKDCGPHIFDKPVVLLPTHIKEDLRFTPLIIQSLRNKGALVLPFETCPEDVDLASLKKEILDSLADIESSLPMDMLSRADEVLKRAKPGSQLFLIKEKAQAYISQSNGLLIPGGPDVEEEFYKSEGVSNAVSLEHIKKFISTLTGLNFLDYNSDASTLKGVYQILVDKGFVQHIPENTIDENFILSIGQMFFEELMGKDIDCSHVLQYMLTKCGRTEWSETSGPIDVARFFLIISKFYFDSEENSLARSITEFALLQSANDRNLPTLGICRGAQLINVFLGGTLQDVTGQKGYQKLHFTNSRAAMQLKSKLGIQEPFIGYSCHHQAVDRLGKGVEVVLKYSDIVKLFVHSKLPIIASQFHPEQTLDVDTFESYKEDLKKEGATDITPSSYYAFMRANLGIYKLFIDKVAGYATPKQSQ